MAYTRDGIMAQIWVAFGQGTGAVRVSQNAAMELHRWYYDAITDTVVDTDWGTQAGQALERIRAVGRMAAATITLSGATAIAPMDVHNAALQVKLMSDTLLCPEPAPSAPEP